jgi:alkaline phosphatase D
MPLRLARSASGDYANFRMFQRYDWGRLARFHVLDDRQNRAHHACQSADGRSGSVLRRACSELRDPRRTMLGSEQEAWLASGLQSSRARWNIIAQQTLMAQATQVKIVEPEDGRFWTDGWDGYPVARRRLLEALAGSGAANPLVISGDVHRCFASELRADFDRPVSSANPVLAAEFCGTSVTSSSGPQKRTLEQVALNPHMKYGRSDKRGFMLMEVTPARTTTHFVGLDDVRDAATKAETLASFVVDAGRAGLARS